MKMKKITAFGVAGMFALVALAGCSADKDKNEVESGVEVEQSVEVVQSGGVTDYIAENGLKGTYHLVNLNIDGKDTPITQYEIKDPVVLTVDQEGNIEGKACNNFKSTITAEGETTAPVSTKMNCEDPKDLMYVEQAVMGTIEGSVIPSQDGDLVLVGTNGDQSVWGLVSEE